MGTLIFLILVGGGIWWFVKNKNSASITGGSNSGATSGARAIVPHKSTDIVAHASTPDFTPTDAYPKALPKNSFLASAMTETMRTSFLAFDGSRGKLLLFTKNPNGEVTYYPINGQTLKSCEVIEDGEVISVVTAESNSRTRRGSQVAGAVVGGLVAGPAGLIVGGMTGKKTKTSTQVSKTQEKINKLTLRLVTTDLNSPIKEFDFIFSPTPRTSPMYKNARLLADTWLTRVEQICEQEVVAV